MLELTREQLTDLVRSLDHAVDQLAGSDGVAAWDILRHDEILRAKLAQAEQQYKSLQVENDRKGNMILEYDKIQLELKAQLAQAQNEICTASDQIPPDMDGDSLSVALIKLTDARRELQAQLATVTAEKEELIGQTFVNGEEYSKWVALRQQLTQRDTELARLYRIARAFQDDSGMFDEDRDWWVQQTTPPPEAGHD